MKTRHKTPKLIPLDMSKSKEHSHPDINCRNTYLCLIDREFFVGKFTREWYGFNFEGWYSDSGLQFDAPGFNCSKWQQIWKVKRQ